MKRRGLVISGCLFLLAGLFFCLWLVIQFSSRTISDPDLEPRPVVGTPKAYRRTEFVATVSGLEGVARIHFSSKHDRVFFEGFSLHEYGSLSHPERGWVVLIPGEKMWLKMTPQGEKDLWKLKAPDPRVRLLKDYELNRRSFPGFVQTLTTRPPASSQLEMRGRYSAEVLHSESSRPGFLQEGFKKHTQGSHSEFCPELGVVLLQKGMRDGTWRTGLSVQSIEERPIPDSLFSVPKAYREIPSL